MSHPNHYHKYSLLFRKSHHYKYHVHNFDILLVIILFIENKTNEKKKKRYEDNLDHIFQEDIVNNLDQKIRVCNYTVLYFVHKLMRNFLEYSNYTLYCFFILFLYSPFIIFFLKEKQPKQFVWLP